MRERESVGESVKERHRSLCERERECWRECERKAQKFVRETECWRECERKAQKFVRERESVGESVKERHRSL